MIRTEGDVHCPTGFVRSLSANWGVIMDGVYRSPCTESDVHTGLVDQCNVSWGEVGRDGPVRSALSLFWFHHHKFHTFF